MPAQKAAWLLTNFRRIEEMGEIDTANQQARAARGRDAKLAFMREFDGIGDKYARNI